MKKIFIITPANWVTGGVELCYQLADILNRETERAFMIYHPFHSHWKAAAAYGRYKAPTAQLEDVKPGSIVVLPEVFAPLIKRFPQADIYFWWMSVDNFYVSAGRTVLGKLLGVQRAVEMQFRLLRRTVALHMYQSEYARIFLDSASLEPSSRLSDFLADEFVQAIASPPGWPRENILVYNPAKGQQKTELILRALNVLSPIPKIAQVIGYV